MSSAEPSSEAILRLIRPIIGILEAINKLFNERFTILRVVQGQDFKAPISSISLPRPCVEHFFPQGRLIIRLMCPGALYGILHSIPGDFLSIRPCQGIWQE